MSENETPQVRTEEPELNDEALEQVAGGCQWGDSTMGTTTIGTIGTVGTIGTQTIIIISPTIEPGSTLA